MKKLDLVVAVIGLAIFTVVMKRVGPTVLAMDLRDIGVALALLLVFSVVRLLLQTYSWSAALKINGMSSSFPELIGVRLASQSLGYLSTFGPMLSEPLKIRLLGTSRASAASTLADTGIYWFTSSLFGIGGCVAAALLLGHSRYTGWLALIACAFLSGIILIARKSPLLTPIVRVLGSRSPGWLRKGEEVETRIRLFRREHPHAVHRMFWLDTICQLLMAGEVAVVLWALRGPLHILTILAIEVCTRAVKMAAGWVPARIGADESGAIGAFSAFGLAPASGFTLAIVRRTRDLLWCVVGLSWLLWNTHRTRTSQASKMSEEALCKL
ncbi:MAG TPA: hypothetical protein VMF91_25480 [Bryobacteraceae bacterium]|nr:hypothetical protein [Bryobacteraceae bacterium]